MALAAQGNNLIQANAPWKLVKTDPAAAAQVIADALQLVKALALLIDPVMPDTAQRIWCMLGQPGEVAGHRLDECAAPLAPASLALPTPLFARLEEKRVTELEALLATRVAEAERRAACETASPDAPLTIEEFGRMELVVGRVLEAEPIKKSKNSSGSWSM